MSRMYEGVFWTFIVISVVLNFAYSAKCTSFNNILVNVETRTEELLNITSLSGSIDRTSLANLPISKVFVREQDVFDIGTDCVRHLRWLKTLVFSGCPIKSLSSGAFRNLPTLWNLQISYGNLTTVPAGVFDAIPTLRMIRLNDNFIHTIAERAFSSLPDLRKLHMANNRLKVWENLWFFNTTSIEVLDFKGNKMEVIPSRAFLYMLTLKQLIFDYNEIRSIEQESFVNAKDLEYLGLGYNRLKELNEDSIPNDMKVRSLRIDANYLNYISLVILKKLSVKELIMDGNPWKCPCLDRINYWIYSRNVTLTSSGYCNNPKIPVCFYPQSYSTTCLEVNDELMTNRFVEKLRKMKKEVNKHCARLD